MVDPAIQKGYQSPDELAQADPEGSRPLDLQWQAKDSSDEANGTAGTTTVDVPEGGARPGDGSREAFVNV